MASTLPYISREELDELEQELRDTKDGYSPDIDTLQRTILLDLIVAFRQGQIVGCPPPQPEHEGRGKEVPAIDYVEWKRRYAARLMHHGWNERAAIKEAEYVWAAMEGVEDIPTPEDAADQATADARKEDAPAGVKACDLCAKGFPVQDGQHYGTQALGMIPTTPCTAGVEASDSEGVRTEKTKP